MTEYQRCPTCGKVWQGIFTEPNAEFPVPDLCQDFNINDAEIERHKKHLTSTSEQGIDEIFENPYNTPLRDETN